jgi:hypothetical protein
LGNIKCIKVDQILKTNISYMNFWFFLATHVIRTNQIHSAVLVVKVRVAQPVMKFPNFHGTQSSLSYSFGSTTGPVLNQINSLHIFTLYSFKVYYIILPSTIVPRGVLGPKRSSQCGVYPSNLWKKKRNM